MLTDVTMFTRDDGPRARRPQHDRRWRVRTVTLLTALSLLATPMASEAGKKKSKAEKRQAKIEQKVDKALRRALDTGNTDRLRVIVRTKPGYREALRRSLESHGDTGVTGHEAIEAVSALVHADDVGDLAEDPSIESVSIDAVVQVEGKKKKQSKAEKAAEKAAKNAAKAAEKAAKDAAKAAEKAAKDAAKAEEKAAEDAAKAQEHAAMDADNAKAQAEKVKEQATKGEDDPWDDDTAMPFDDSKAAGDQSHIHEAVKDLRKTLGMSGKGWKTSGRGVGVAIIDTGIAESQDLQGRIIAFYDFTRGGKAVAPYDDHGHGSHIAGVMAGNVTKGKSGYRGIAPEVDLIGLKVLDADGSGYTSDVIAALEFAVLFKDALGIDIINLSLGHPIFEPAASDPLVQAVEAAVRAGIVVVASAGNFGESLETGEVGYAGVTSPGNAPSALTVGALDTQDTVSRADDRIPSYSSRGPSWYDGHAKPDLVAPGDHLIADVGSPKTQLLRDSCPIHDGGREGLLLHGAERYQHGRRRHERRRGTGARGQPQRE